MESFYLKRTKKTPEINFDVDQGIFQISGRSIPENAIEFYKPVLDWFENYIQTTPHPTSQLKIQLEYFNTSSSKCLVDLFRKLERLYKNGNNISVVWYFDFEDEDMLESGEDFKKIIDIPLEIKAFNANQNT